MLRFNRCRRKARKRHLPCQSSRKCSTNTSASAPLCAVTIREHLVHAAHRSWTRAHDGTQTSLRSAASHANGRRLDAFQHERQIFAMRCVMSPRASDACHAAVRRTLWRCGVQRCHVLDACRMLHGVAARGRLYAVGCVRGSGRAPLECLSRREPLGGGWPLTTRCRWRRSRRYLSNATSGRRWTLKIKS